MPNDDSLLAAMFKEVAVIQGKRTPDGQWIDATPWHAQNALEVAMRLVESARNASTANRKVEIPFESSRNA